ncbi:MAG: sarcosine oxidase subunit alpha family protein [Chromatiales bacterium]|nr:sarcosine oxidase subunit alpha family protein [Chromatiales bacterium]
MSEQPFRLFAGGRVDRERPLDFVWAGRRLQGYAGDTLASALLANGIHLVGRSFKYHRPRGILSAGAEEPNALVQLERGARTQPNLRATQVELYAGLHAEPQNCWPSLELDVGAINGLVSRLLPAGFYYKTFMWPRDGWMVYERFIRRAAGLGRAPSEGPDPDVYDKMHVHCDVLVVGAGPAGLAAALAAGASGARVILADEQSEPGGSLLATRETLDGEPAARWVERALADLGAMDEVRVLPRTTVFGYHDHNYLTLAERVTDHLPPGSAPDRPRQRLWKVRAREVVLATGAHERPMVFAQNDRPGIMLAGAARTYVNRYGVRPADRALVVAADDGAYAAAVDLADVGVEVTVVDVRAQAPACAEQARARSIEVLAGHGVVRTFGGSRVRAAEVAPLDGTGAGWAGGARTLRCDLVAMCGGWNPTVHLFSQAGGRLAWNAERACFVPAEARQRVRVAGAANGTFSLAAALTEGRAGGDAAARAAGFSGGADVALPAAEEGAEPAPTRALWSLPTRPPGGAPAKHFVDFQNDVTANDVALAAREGYRSVEHLKRYTTTGMGTDQGKTSNVNALGILAGLLGREVPEVGTTTFRPPYTPVTFGVLAGRDVGALADPVRTTPMHRWHVAQGARFEDVGQWKRPWYYPRPGESMHDAVSRECLAARNAVALLDASTLGKIEVRGPDAGELLDRIYTNGFKKLPVGRCRYGLMCREDGMVLDDGVSARLADDRFLVHTTTGNAARVLAWLEEWRQTEWPELRVWCDSVTEQWATASLSGPFARRLLGELTRDIDLDPEAFPFMAWRAGTVAGIPARVMRVSFTGEQSYEVSVGAGFGLALWTAIALAGERYGLTPFGTETMHVLRAEKGFIIAGQDTDGTVTPHDLGLGAMVARHKDFIGKRSLARADTVRADRKQLVGLRTDDPREVLPEGGQIVARAGGRPPVPMLGHVTSSYWSANLGHSIALALVKGGHARLGESLVVQLPQRSVPVTVVAPTFLDPDGERMRG